MEGTIQAGELLKAGSERVGSVYVMTNLPYSFSCECLLVLDRPFSQYERHIKKHWLPEGWPRIIKGLPTACMVLMHTPSSIEDLYEVASIEYILPYIRKYFFVTRSIGPRKNPLLKLHTDNPRQAVFLPACFSFMHPLASTNRKDILYELDDDAYEFYLASFPADFQSLPPDDNIFHSRSADYHTEWPAANQAIQRSPRKMPLSRYKRSMFSPLKKE